ncbi:MAG: EAL domain-containing protein [Pseudomonadota bacterium]
MTVANKVTLLFFTVALLLVLSLTIFTAYREYHAAFNSTVSTIVATERAHPELQVAIYRRNPQELLPILEDFFAIPAVTGAIARDGLQDLLAEADRGSGTPVAPPFHVLRSDASTADTSVDAYNAALEPVAIGLWSAWFGDNTQIYVSLPVFTAVNPGQQGLRSYDFFVAPLDPTTKSSLRVIGYLQLRVSPKLLLASGSSTVWMFLLGGLLLTLAAGVAVALMARRITRDLSKLAKLAEGVVSGESDQPVEFHAKGEIGEIAAVLNSVIGGLTSLKRETVAGQKLLSMKVDERTSQLSERDEELTRAAEEISETKTRLERLAYYDNLTELPNRRLFTEQLDLLLDINQRNGHTLALLFLNIDNFKRINDSLGHAAGDQVLVEIAERLVLSVRESDAVGHYVESEHRIEVSRLGGDEFTVVLNQMESVDSATAVATRLLNELEKPLNVGEQELVISPSIGIATAPHDSVSAEGLLKLAGIAMHHAKESVRDQFLFYSEEMDASGVARLKLEADLRKAVERNELVLHYQPQVNTVSGAVVGAEALLRWEHPERGSIPPFQFISLAEQIGVITELGDWVLAETCRQIKAFDAIDLKLPRVAINVSAFQFKSDFVQKVTEALAQFELEASRLELGLSESILMDGSAADTVGQLRELGLHLSVDDFGASSAPIGYLSRYDLDELRIDRSFVRECASDANAARLVKAIIAMAKSLEIGVIAEGVETAQQYRFLLENGADVMQGYLFSRPLPAEEFQHILAPWHFMQQLQGLQE